MFSVSHDLILSWKFNLRRFNIQMIFNLPWLSFTAVCCVQGLGISAAEMMTDLLMDDRQRREDPVCSTKKSFACMTMDIHHIPEFRYWQCTFLNVFGLKVLFSTQSIVNKCLLWFKCDHFSYRTVPWEGWSKPLEMMWLVNWSLALVISLYGE